MRLIGCFVLLVLLVACSTSDPVFSDRETGNVVAEKSAIPEVLPQTQVVLEALQDSYRGVPGVIIVRVVNAVQLILPSDPLFAVGQTVLSEDVDVLSRFLQVMQVSPGMLVRVECLTDSSGAAQQNLALSRQRAAAVKQYLIDHGASAEMVLATGYGAQYPMATNDTKAGRAQNRRIVFTLDFNLPVPDEEESLVAPLPQESERAKGSD